MRLVIRAVGFTTLFLAFSLAAWGDSIPKIPGEESVMGVAPIECQQGIVGYAKVYDTNGKPEDGAELRVIGRYTEGVGFGDPFIWLTYGEGEDGAFLAMYLQPPGQPLRIFTNYEQVRPLVGSLPAICGFFKALFGGVEVQEKA